MPTMKFSPEIEAAFLSGKGTVKIPLADVKWSAGGDLGPVRWATAAPADSLNCIVSDDEGVIAVRRYGVWRIYRPGYSLADLVAFFHVPGSCFTESKAWRFGGAFGEA